MANDIPDIPPDMRKVYRRLRRWRSSHARRISFPGALWAAAGELAREHGINRTAEAGDLKSLIHTCELNDVNPFDYLTELQKRAAELAKNPVTWMRWNDCQTLLQAGTSKDSA